MRVALLTRDPGPGGRELVFELVPRLRDLGWDARLFWDDPRPPPAGRFPPGLGRPRLAARSPTARSLALAGRRAQAALVAPGGLARLRRSGPAPRRRGSRWTQARIVAWRPDVLHATAAIALDRRPLLAALRARVVVSFGGDERIRTGDDEQWRALWALADAVHCASPAAASEAALPDGLAVRVSPAGAPGALGAAAEGSKRERGGPLRILSASHLTWSHGHELFLRALAPPLGDGLEFSYRIAGRGPHADAVTFAPVALGIADRVRLLGDLGSAQMRAQLEWADLFVDPSIAPAASPAAAAALAMGTPVLATERGGVEPARGVTLVRPGDPSAWAAALKGVNGGPGRRRPAPQPGAAELAADLDGLYRSVLGMAP